MSPVFIYNDSVIGPNFEWLWDCIPKNASRSLLRRFTAAGGARLRDFDDEAREQHHAPECEVSIRLCASSGDARPIHLAEQDKSGAGHPGAIKAHTEVAWFAGRNGIERVRPVAGEALHRRRAVDKHWRPQSDYVCDKDGAIAVSFVGKIERLETDLGFVEPHVGDLEPLLHKNATVAEPDETLSDRSREILRYVYRRDFHIFGYE